MRHIRDVKEATEIYQNILSNDLSFLFFSCTSEKHDGMNI